MRLDYTSIVMIYNFKVVTSSLEVKVLQYFMWHVEIRESYELDSVLDIIIMYIVHPRPYIRVVLNVAIAKSVTIGVTFEIKT